MRYSKTSPCSETHLQYIQVWGGGGKLLFSGLDHNLILSANSCTHGCIEAKPYLITVVFFT